MSAHTPGPWEVRRHGGRGKRTYLRACAPDGRLLAELNQMTEPAEECEANARLISAAPTMAEALSRILGLTGADRFGNEIDIIASAALKKAGVQ